MSLIELIYLTLTLTLIFYVQQKSSLKRKQSSQKKKNSVNKKRKIQDKKKTKEPEEPEEPEETEETWLVDKILGFKKSRKKDSEGFELKIQWEGSTELTWEPMGSLLNSWACTRANIYKFLKKEKIQIHNCENLNLITGTAKLSLACGKKTKKNKK